MGKLKIRRAKDDLKSKKAKKAKAKTPAEDAIVAKEIRDWNTTERALKVGNISSLIGAGLGYGIANKKRSTKGDKRVGALVGATAGKQLGTVASLAVDKAKDAIRRRKKKKAKKKTMRIN